MSERFTGNYEIVDALTDASRTVTGNAIDPDAAEAVLAAVEGLTGITAVEPEATGTAMPVGQWEAVDPAGRPVVVKLWREPALSETAIGQAIAAVLAEQEA